MLIFSQAIAREIASIKDEISAGTFSRAPSLLPLAQKLKVGGSSDDVQLLPPTQLPLLFEECTSVCFSCS
jgi:hypothetical protein